MVTTSLVWTANTTSEFSIREGNELLLSGLENLIVFSLFFFNTFCYLFLPCASIRSVAGRTYKSRLFQFELGKGGPIGPESGLFPLINVPLVSFHLTHSSGTIPLVLFLWLHWQGTLREFQQPTAVDSVHEDPLILVSLSSRLPGESR